MEITLCRRNELDRSGWDKFISTSPQGYIYGLSDYLDIISPDWDALICRKEDEWLAVMPWFPKQKFGIKYVFQPVLCQFQGISFSQSSNSISDQRNIGTLFADEIKKQCHVFHCNFSGGFDYPFPFIWKSFSVQPMVNFTIQLQTDVPYTQAFSHGTLENIKRAEKSDLSYRIGTTLENSIQLFKKYKSAELPFFVERNYDQLRRIYEVFSKKEMAYVGECISPNGEVLATILLLKYNSSLIQLFTSVSNEGKKCGAMAFSILKSLEFGKETGCNVFDFEGSMIEPIESFFRSFGAKPRTYWKIRRSPITRLLKRFG